MSERYVRQGADAAPKIGVLLSYAKIVLFDELVDSDLPDDPYFTRNADGLFPGQDAQGPCR